jgi:hypothetical protein
MVTFSDSLVEEMPKDFDPNAELAREVLRTELGDFYSAEDEKLHTKAWEAQTGRPLKMESESWADFKTRAAKFAKKSKPTVDVQTAREELDRLLKVDLDDMPEDTEDEQPRKHYVGLVHEYEDRLSLPRTDFSKPKPKAEEADKVSLERFNAAQKGTTYLDRMKFVEQERDLGCLNLIAMRDENEEVRKAAERRIVRLALNGR